MFVECCHGYQMWTIGVVIWQMLMGHDRPYAGLGVSEVMCGLADKTLGAQLCFSVMFE